MLSDANTFTERSLTYRNTKLFCPSVHGLQAVVTLTEDNLAVLQCGCTRSNLLPLREHHISIEQLSPFAPNSDQRIGAKLFPATATGEITAQRLWFQA